MQLINKAKENRRRKIDETATIEASITISQADSVEHDNEEKRRNLTKRPRTHHVYSEVPSLLVLCDSSTASDQEHETHQMPATSLKPSHLELLPPELFCSILSFIGPTSASLLSLTQLNHNFHGTMKAVGKAMLSRVKSHFRVPLKRESPFESSTSHFVRHARRCSIVLDQLTQLRSLLTKQHSAMMTSEVQYSMDVALELLEAGPSFSIELERQILATCGKCGGKAFKYSKWRLAQSLAQPVDNDATYTELRSQNRELSKTEVHLDMSRLVMQTVVFRDWQLAPKKTGKATRMQKQPSMMKELPRSGYFWK